MLHQHFLWGRFVELSSVVPLDGEGRGERGEGRGERGEEGEGGDRVEGGGEERKSMRGGRGGKENGVLTKKHKSPCK